MSLDEILKFIDLPALALELYPTCKAKPDKECRGVAVWREGERDSVSFFKPNGVWLFKDFAADISGNAYTFLTKCAGYTKEKALELLKYKAGVGNSRKPKTQKTIIATYDYTDEEGEVLFQVVRFEPKGFRQRTPDGQGGWLWKLGKVRRVLYRLPKVLEVKKTGVAVFLVEGEKDVQMLESKSFIATTCPMGAKKWRKEYSEALRGLDVIISPDNDPKGREHAEMVAKALIGIARSVRVLKLPNLKEKQDISDWFGQGGTVEELNRIIAETPEFDGSFSNTSPVKPVKIEETIIPIGPVQKFYSAVINLGDWSLRDLEFGFKDGKVTVQDIYSANEIMSLFGYECDIASLVEALGLSVRLLHHVGKDIVWHPNLGVCVWNDFNWEIDGTQEGYPLAIRQLKLASSILREEKSALKIIAARLRERAVRKDDEQLEANALALETVALELNKAAINYEKPSRLVQALTFMKAERKIGDVQLEPKAMVLPLKTKIWDKGKIREPRREDFIFRMGAVDKEKIKLDSWLEVLSAITGNDTDLQISLQDLSGYVLSGKSTHKFIAWLFGPNDCGKSLFTELLSTVLGNLAQPIQANELSPYAHRGRLGFHLWQKRLGFIKK